MGGGWGASTSSPLFAFKQRFDPDSQPLRFQVAKLVHDGDRYRQLAGTDATDGFFPPGVGHGDGQGRTRQCRSAGGVTSNPRSSAAP